MLTLLSRDKNQMGRWEVVSDSGDSGDGWRLATLGLEGVESAGPPLAGLCLLQRSRAAGRSASGRRFERGLNCPDKKKMGHGKAGENRTEEKRETH